MQQEFGKHHKHNKTTAKSVGNGIANSVTDKQAEQLEQMEAQAFVLAKLGGKKGCLFLDLIPPRV